MQHQQFEESPYQNFNFVPYSEASNFEQMPTNENFPSIQTNELYEFLPEEIFQLGEIEVERNRFDGS